METLVGSADCDSPLAPPTRSGFVDRACFKATVRCPGGADRGESTDQDTIPRERNRRRCEGFRTGPCRFPNLVHLLRQVASPSAGLRNRFAAVIVETGCRISETCSEPGPPRRCASKSASCTCREDKQRKRLLAIASHLHALGDQNTYVHGPLLLAANSLDWTRIIGQTIKNSDTQFANLCSATGSSPGRRSCASNRNKTGMPGASFGCKDSRVCLPAPRGGLHNARPQQRGHGNS